MFWLLVAWTICLVVRSIPPTLGHWQVQLKLALDRLLQQWCRTLRWGPIRGRLIFMTVYLTSWLLIRLMFLLKTLFTILNFSSARIGLGANPRKNVVCVVLLRLSLRVSAVTFGHWVAKLLQIWWRQVQSGKKVRQPFIPFLVSVVSVLDMVGTSVLWLWQWAETLGR